MPEKCGKPAASFIPRRGEYFACVLPEGHEGECQPGGTCHKHGAYSSPSGKSPQCPRWPDCINELSATAATGGFALLPLSDREREVLGQLAKQRDMSEEAVLRQALRMYQLADGFFELGYELAFRKPDGEYIRPLHMKSKMEPLDDDSDGWGWSRE